MFDYELSVAQTSTGQQPCIKSPIYYSQVVVAQLSNHSNRNSALKHSSSAPLISCSLLVAEKHSITAHSPTDLLDKVESVEILFGA